MAEEPRNELREEWLAHDYTKALVKSIESNIATLGARIRVSVRDGEFQRAQAMEAALAALESVWSTIKKGK